MSARAILRRNLAAKVRKLERPDVRTTFRRSALPLDPEETTATSTETAYGDARMTTDTARSTAFWTRSHYLDRMDLRDLLRAFFTYPTIIAYLVLAALFVGLFIAFPAGLLSSLAVVAIAVVVYPLVWYVLHRFVLHSTWMYKVPVLAKTWKRTHYDHHQDPNHLEVLFGSLWNTVPTILLATMPIGWLVGGFGGAAIGAATGMLLTVVNEFVHCIQHLAIKPKNALLLNMKARHLEHHYHDETGNFGITSFAADKLFRTHYTRGQRKTRSATVFNLGYTDEVADRYPWVKQLSGGVVASGPTRRRPVD